MKTFYSSLNRGLLASFLLLFSIVFNCSDLAAQAATTPPTWDIRFYPGKDACPGDPVRLEVNDTLYPLAKGEKYVWFLNDNIYKSTKTKVCVIESAVFSGDVMTVGVAKYPATQAEYVLQIPKSPSCESPLCNQSATGEYIFGTDFTRKNYADGYTSFSPNDVYTYFPDNVNFTGDYGNFVLGGNNQFESRSGFLPSGVNGGSVDNDYLFLNSGQQLPHLQFEGYAGKPFRIWMRFYVKLLKGDQKDFKFKQNGSFGNAIGDAAIEVSVFNETNPSEVFQPIKQPEYTKNFEYSLSPDCLYRVDVVVSGTFLSNDTKNELIPQLEASGNHFTALDFISYESETICVTPRSGCLYSWVHVVAAGFAYNGNFDNLVWQYEKEDNVWEPLGGAVRKASGYNSDSHTAHAEIRLDRNDLTKYRVGVKGESIRWVEFSLNGEDCRSNSCVSIASDTLYCLVDGDHEVRLELKDKELLNYIQGDKYYRWRIFGPTGGPLNGENGGVDARRDFEKFAEKGTLANGERSHASYKDYDKDNAGNVTALYRNDKGAHVFFNPWYLNEFHDFSEDNDNKRHMAVVEAKDATLKSICVSDTFYFRIARDPRLRRFKLTAPDHLDGKLCSAELENPIDLKVEGLILNGENGYVDKVENYSTDFNYIYTWTSATGKTPNTWEAILNVDKEKACAGTDTKYTPTVEINNLGCKQKIEVDYEVTKTEEPTLDCTSLTDVVLELGPNGKPNDFVVPPFPKAEVTCGEADKKITLDGAGDYQPGDVISSLALGVHRLVYTVTDGCGRSKSCTLNITVTAAVPPTIACDEIENITKDAPACSTTVQVMNPLVENLTKEDKVTVSLYGTAFTKNDPGLDPNKYEQTSTLPLSYKVGDTYLLWAFADSMGNVAYCSQKISVNYAAAFAMDCKMDVSVNDTINVCDGKSWEEIKAAAPSFVAKFPTASYYDCGNEQPVGITPTISYKKQSEGDAAYKPLTNETLLYNTVYTIRWEFAPTGDNLNLKPQYCYASIVLRDNEPPVVDCEKFPNATVLVNYDPNKKENDKDKYLGYASGAAPDGVKDNYIFTLAGKLHFPTIADITDNCTTPGEVGIGVSIEKPDGTMTTIATDQELQKFQFAVGSEGQANYLIHFTFTDKDGNVGTCEQQITVVTQLTPKPTCPASPVNLTAKEPVECNASYTFGATPTAEMEYWKITKEFPNEETCPAVNMPLDGRTGDGPNACDGYNLLDTYKMTEIDKVTIYPYKFVKVENGSERVITENNSLKKVVETKWLINLKKKPAGPPAPGTRPAPAPPAKEYEGDPYWWNGDNNPDKQDAHKVCTNDFTADDRKKIQDAFTDMNIGEHQFRWYYKNNEGVEAYCDFTVNVEDKTKPEIECPASPVEVETTESNEDCSAIVDLSKYKPVEVKDCADPSKITYAYEIWKKQEGGNSVVVAKTDVAKQSTQTLEVGSYLVKWYVTDDNNNVAECSFDLEVEDKTKPSVVCPNEGALVELYAKTDCKVDYEVKVADFNISDNCGEAFLYSYQVDEGEEQLIPSGATSVLVKDLAVGGHTIKWIVTEVSGAGNKGDCDQPIVVYDDADFSVTCPSLDSAKVQSCKDQLTWSELKTLLGEMGALPTSTKFYYCNGKTEKESIETVQYKETESEAYLPVNNGTTFDKNKVYDIRFIYTKPGSSQGGIEYTMAKADTCSLPIVIGDFVQADFNCTAVADLILDVKKACDTTYVMVPPYAAVSDECTKNPSDFKWYYTIMKEGTTGDEPSEKSWTSASAEKLAVGSVYEVKWFVEDKAGNRTEASCPQKITVRDARPINITCPKDADVTFNWCVGKTWKDVKDALVAAGNYPKAEFIRCGSSEPEKLSEIIKYSDDGGTTWTDLLDGTAMAYDTEYMVKWEYTLVGGQFNPTLTASCSIKFRIKDIEKPTADCSKMVNIDLFLKSHEQQCDTLYKLLTPQGVFTDNCDVSGYRFSWNFQNGADSKKDYTDENASLTLAPGVHTITWWATDKQGNESAVSCQQKITVRDSILFDLDCAVDGTAGVVDMELCNAPSVSELINELTNNYKPTAAFNASKKCDGVSYPEIADTIYIREQGDADWVVLKNLASALQLKHTYEIKWVFTANATDKVALMKDSCLFTVRLGDVTKPVIGKCPVLKTLQTANNATDCNVTYKLEFQVLQITDNCGNNVQNDFTFEYKVDDGEAKTVSGETFVDIVLSARKEPYTISVVAIDKAGNRSEECSHQVQVNDETAPKFTACPQPHDLLLKLNCDTTIKVSAPVATDNCDTNLSYFYTITKGGTPGVETEYTAPFNHTFGLGTTIITWVAVDQSGKRSQPCEETYQITDSRGLTIFCPSEKNVIIDNCESLAWNDVKKRLPEQQTPVAKYIDCSVTDGDKEKELDPVSITYKEKDAVGSASDISGLQTLEYGKTYEIIYNYKLGGAETDIALVEKSCSIFVTVKDSSAPAFDCDKVADDIILDVVNGCDTLYELIAPAVAVSDVCTTDSADFSFSYTIDGGAVNQFGASSQERFNTGKKYELVWTVTDKNGNEAHNTCAQTITVNDKRKIDIECPTDNSITFNWCEREDGYKWSDAEFSIIDTLRSSSNSWPKASAKLCENGNLTETVVALDSVLSVSSDNGATWTELTDETVFDYNMPYIIKWVYTKSGEFFAEVSAECRVSFLIKDTESPKVHCDNLADYDIFIHSTACDTAFVLREPTGVFTDNCVTEGEGGGLVWNYTYGPKNGTASSEETYDKEELLTFKPGEYTITWWATDKENNKSDVCPQTVTVRDSFLFALTCPDTEDDKVYDVQVCESPSGAVLLDSLTRANYKPTAEFTKNCDGFTFPTINEDVYIKKADETTWTLLSGVSSLELASNYQVMWVFSVTQSNTVAAMADTCQFEIRIGDVTKPTFTCPAEADAVTAVNAADCVAKMTIDLSAFAPVDNCEKNAADFRYGYYINDYSTDTTYVDYDAADTRVEVSMPVRDAAYTVVWVVADAAGNRAECEQTVTAKDETKPVIDCPAQDSAISLTAHCDTVIKVIAPVATDNCTQAESLQFSYQIKAAGAEEFGAVTEYNGAFDLPLALGTTTIKWVAKDEATKESEPCERNYVVTDNTGFTFFCPEMKDVIIDACETTSWANVKDLLPEAQTPYAKYTDCKAEREEDREAYWTPTITYRPTEPADGTFEPITDGVNFEFEKTYEVKYLFRKEGDNVETLEQECSIFVTVKDSSAPAFDCDKVADDIILDVVNGCDTLYKLIAPAVAVSDVCTTDSADFSFSYTIDGGAVNQFGASSQERFNTGKKYELVWTVTDKNGNEAHNTCAQTITVNDKRKIDIECPTDNSITFNWCEREDGYKWSDAEFSIIDTLRSSSNSWPKASAKLCVDGNLTETVVALDSVLSVSSDNGATWTELTDETVFDYNKPYIIKWVYTKSGEFFAEVSAECRVSFLIKDTESPKAHCDNLADYDIFIHSTACDTAFVLREPTGVFTDNCVTEGEGGGLVWNYTYGPKNGTASSEKIYDKDESLTFKPGEYTITWWATDKESNKSDVCPQTVTVRDSFLFALTCPDTEDDKVYDVQVCESPSGAVLLDSLTQANYKPTAEFTKNCDGFTFPTINEDVYIKKADETTWTLLSGVSSLELASNYQVMWVFSVTQSNTVAAMADTCQFEIRIGDVTKPTFTCPAEADAVTAANAADCVAKMTIDLSAFAPVDNCEKNAADFRYGYYINDYSTDTTYVGYDAADTRVEVSMPVRDAAYTVVWVVADAAGNRAECEQTVTAKDETKPVIVCPPAVVESLTKGCSMDLALTPVVGSDNCTETTTYYSRDGKTFEAVATETVDATFEIGVDSVYWFVVDVAGNSSDTCLQYVTINNNEKFDIYCPQLKEDQTEFVIEACDALTWEAVKDSLDKFDMSAWAESVDCKKNEVVRLDSVIMMISEKDSKEWTLMTKETSISPDVIYDIHWIFTKYGENVITQKDTCHLSIVLKDTTMPIFDCVTIDPDSMVFVFEDACEGLFKDIKFNEYKAKDNCDGDIEGVLSWTKNLEDAIAEDEKFVVGELYNMYWIFQDESGNKVVCDQKLMLNSDKKPIFNCDSLNNAPIEKVLEGVCEIPAADLNIEAPIALDACTKAEIVGKPHRKSGKTMEEHFVVGRDTIVWVFESEYATATDSCEQYVFIQSDMKPIFNCDSLNNAPIEKVLEGVCEIPAADLNIEAPIALDACTNAEIVGKPHRKSGKTMEENFVVGRDTIVWVFESEYATATDSCEQYVFIQSDMKPIFNCDSLNNAPIEKVLEGVCEIPVADLNIEAPIALDACTKAEIVGKPHRKSGKTMEENFVVGRDTIVWVFESEYATATDSCEQYVFIQSDMKPIFNCDSLNNAPIEKVLEGVCEIPAVDLNIEAPIALDACTKAEIVGKPHRKSGKTMEENFVVGRDTIVWVFESEYATATDSCEQYVFIQSDMKPIFNCDSLNNAPIEKVLEGVCEIPVADLNIEAPIALDACTKAEIVGKPHRKSGKTMEENFVVGRDTIVWVFESEYATATDSCEQYVFIQSDMKPIFNCDSLNNAPIEKVLEGVCEIPVADLNIEAPIALDACTNAEIVGKPHRKSGKTMEENFVVGRDTIVWVFESEYATETDSCEQYVFIQSDMKPIFNCDSLNNAPIEKVLEGVCEIPVADLNIEAPIALDACTKAEIVGKPHRKSGKTMEENFVVGRDTIVWVFESEYATVTDSCEQYVFIQSDMKPIFNCDSLNNAPIEKELAADQCSVMDVDLNIQAPIAYDACTNDSIVGVPHRKSGKTMDEPFEIGKDTIVWVFESIFTTTTDSCEQYVIIKDTTAPFIDCSIFEEISIIWTELGETVPFDSVVAAGMIKESFISDACDGKIEGTPTRSDGKPFDAPFLLDTTTVITWTYVDASGNDTSCSQIINIASLMEIPITCPELEKDLYSCEEEIPAPYATWEEFKEHGGFGEMEKYLNPSTFGSTDEISGQCPKTLTRTYFILNTKGMRSTCEQVFTIVDTIAPEIITKVESLVLGCKDDIPEAPQVYAVDACQEGEILATMVETNNRLNDIHSCGYYNYTITRTWTAVDACGNVSKPMVQTVTVVDSVSPHFELPDNWKDTLLAEIKKPCMFKVPDFSAKVLPLVRDNCTEMDDLKVWQVPAAGTQVYDTLTAKIYVEDFCGNLDSISIFVLVTPPSTVVSLDAYSLTTCVSDTLALSLWSQRVRFASGFIYVENRKGNIISIPSTFTYDCYKESISEENLVFSNNNNTYGDKFSNLDKDEYNRVRDSLINLTRRSQSGLYYFVAMDTITLCSDTASAYLDLREKPRISMDSGDLAVCEFDSLPLNQIMTKFGVCVDDMGYPLTDEGWMIDGKKYTSADSVFSTSNKLSLSYYAENECGTTNSLDSYFGACFTFPVGADSVDVFGSELNVKLFREDRLTVSSSVTLDVHRRFDANTMILTSNPSDPATIYMGDDASLTLNTNQMPTFVDWYRVVGNYDARFGNTYDIYGSLITSDASFEADDELIARTDSADAKFMEQYLYALEDSARYYVVVSDEVCPAMSSNVVQINVNDFIPTAITPYVKDGLNDVFMKNFPVTIFNRYSQKVYEGIGWDGHYGGTIADPGVYFYEVTLPSGSVKQGTVEVVRF